MKRLFSFAIIIATLLFSCKTKKENTNTAVTTKEPTSSNAMQIDTTKKQIYLTFDDGPTTGSKRLYELLLAKKIPATLYLVGKHYESMPGMHKMLDSLRKQPFIVLANHTYSHAYGDHYLKFYNDIPGVIADFDRAQKILNTTSGIARCAGRNLWRTPVLNITDSINGPGTALDSLYKMGKYNFTGWDCTWPYDYKTFKNTRDVAGMMNRVKLYFDSSFVKQPNSIVILGHDQQYADDEDFKQLSDFIDTILKSKIYQFATMDVYPGLRKK